MVFLLSWHLWHFVINLALTSFRWRGAAWWGGSAWTKLLIISCTSRAKRLRSNIRRERENHLALVKIIKKSGSSIKWLSFDIKDSKIWMDRWRCPWCNGYRRRKWTRQHEFKSWTRLIAFHIALIPLGKVWIQLFCVLMLNWIVWNRTVLTFNSVWTKTILILNWIVLIGSVQLNWIAWSRNVFDN